MCVGRAYFFFRRETRKKVPRKKCQNCSTFLGWFFRHSFNPLRFFKSLYENNFYLRIYYLENTLSNFCSIISTNKNFMNIFGKKLNFPEIFLLKFLHRVKFFLTKKNYWIIKKRSWGIFSKIFATKYQKAGRSRLVLCVGFIGPHVTCVLLFGGVTASG